MMSRALIETGNLVVNLTPSPIEPSWIIEGNPVAQSCVLSRSADGVAATIVVLEGSIILENDTMGPTRYGPGDVIFFRDGAHAKWHVEGRVKKLAFCRKTNPAMLGRALRVFSKIKRTLAPAGKRQPSSLMGAG